MAAINQNSEVTRYLNRPVDESAVAASAMCDHFATSGSSSIGVIAAPTRHSRSRISLTRQSAIARRLLTFGSRTTERLTGLPLRKGQRRERKRQRSDPARQWRRSGISTPAAGSAIRCTDRLVGSLNSWAGSRKIPSASSGANGPRPAAATPRLVDFSHHLPCPQEKTSGAPAAAETPPVRAARRDGLRGVLQRVVSHAQMVRVRPRVGTDHPHRRTPVRCV